jgi:transcriptional regulator with XRE-family HTH domain
MTYGDVMTTAPDHHELPELGFGDRLHRYRLSRGMTLRQFAEGTNVSHATIGRYERTGGNPGDPAVQRLAKLLQMRHRVPAEWLLTGAVPQQRSQWAPSDSNRQPTVYARRHLALAA